MWSAEEMNLHINILEMKALQLTVNAFKHRAIRENLVLVSDNITVVAHVKKQGGTLSLDICKLTHEVMGWLEWHMVPTKAGVTVISFQD